MRKPDSHNRTCGSHRRVRPVTDDRRRFARQQPARGDDARFRNCGPLDASRGVAPRRQLHGYPCHPQPWNRESGSLRRRKRTARAVAVRSAFSPDTHATLNVAILHVGQLEQFQVDAYTRADASAEWRFTNRLSVMAIGQNLFEEAHPEFPGATGFVLGTQVPRSASLRLRWTF